MDPGLLQNISPTAKSISDDFLAIYKQFKLGGLLTEQPNKISENLSILSKNNLNEAIEIMKKIDLNVFDVLLNKLDNLKSLQERIYSTLKSGNRVFIAGTGSTGRLSLTLETLYRQRVQQLNITQYSEKVVSFMTGGDIAIIKSVEDFEDHPEFGAQHLQELGFTKDDLQIVSTEGGETPWVIGTVIKASTIQLQQPFFLYCNPDEVLTVERSQKVLKNDKIHKINLTVGNQTITGSTRMQCSTILTYSIGLSLFYSLEKLKDEQYPLNFVEFASSSVQRVKESYEQVDLQGFLADFIIWESQTYKNKNHLFYRGDETVGISILTDTTERSPTFSLFPFEGNYENPINPSLCYFIIDGEHKDSLEAWEKLYAGRKPRALESKYWDKYKHKVSYETILGHDISQNQIYRRFNYCGNAQHFQFSIKVQDNKFQFVYGQLQNPQTFNKIAEKEIQLKSLKGILETNIILKCILNTLSTLVMGRMNKYFSNIMIHVRPSNNKLKDRSIRYVQYLLEQNKEKIEQNSFKKLDQINYETICLALHSEIENLVYEQAIVIKTFNKICKDIFGLENVLEFI